MRCFSSRDATYSRKLGFLKSKTRTTEKKSRETDGLNNSWRASVIESMTWQTESTNEFSHEGAVGRPEVWGLEWSDAPNYSANKESRKSPVSEILTRTKTLRECGTTRTNHAKIQKRGTYPPLQVPMLFPSSGREGSEDCGNAPRRWLSPH